MRLILRQIACIWLLALSIQLSAQKGALQDSSLLRYFSYHTGHSYDSLKEIGFDAELLAAYTGTDYLPVSMKVLFGNVFQIPDFSNQIGESFIASCDRIPELFYLAYGLLGAPAGGYGPPLRETDLMWEAKFCDYDVDLGAQLINDLKINICDHDRSQWRKLPQQLKTNVLHLLFMMRSCNEILEAYRKPLYDVLSLQSTDDELSMDERLMLPWKNRQMTSFEHIDVIRDVDLRKLSFSSRLLMEELSRLPTEMTAVVDSSFEGCCFESVCGRVAVLGIHDDTVQGDYCLIIDLGGDDRYFGNIATSSLSKPVSVTIDYLGDDSYISDGLQIASGNAGIGVLLDFEGDDYYSCNGFGLGFSLYGSSLLYDFDGDDCYFSSHGYAQASALNGAAILVDKSGNDVYACGDYSQGFGGTLGVGVFMDIKGDDLYNTELPVKHLPVFLQGAGCGRWAEATDGHSLAGGYGIFIEAGGDDRYLAGSFAQGSAYFFGTGLFYERSGDDMYNALTHSQGYAVHKSLACFIDRKGEDIYNAACDPLKITQAIGGGRDLSVGWFVDMAGNDHYHFGNRSVGIGDMNGLGLFWDVKGDDIYNHWNNNIYKHAASMGKTFDVPAGMKSGSGMYNMFGTINRGVFWDLSGNNRFF